MRYLILAVATIIFLSGSSANIYTSPQPPYTFNPETGNTGYLIDFLNEMNGLEYNITFGQWADQINNASADNNGVFLAAVETGGRSGEFVFSDSIVSISHTFYKMKGSDFNYNSYSDLSGLRIGVVKGWQYGDYRFDSSQHLNKIEYQDSTLLMVALYKGEVDIVVTDALISQYVLFHHLNPIMYEIESAGVLSVESLRFMISKNMPNYNEVKDYINIEIQKVKETTDVASLLHKYRI